MAHSIVSKMFRSRPIGERDVIFFEMGGNVRPAICLRKMPKYGDLLVCAVSTQLDQCIEGFDVIVDPSTDTGIIRKSVIRLSCLGRVEAHESPGRIGTISVPLHRRLLKNLSEYLVSI